MAQQFCSGKNGLAALQPRAKSCTQVGCLSDHKSTQDQARLMDTGVTEAEANGQLLGDCEGIPVMGGTLILSNSQLL